MKGASKLCPKCHKVIVKDIDIKEGSIVFRCPNEKCKQNVKAVVESKTIVKIIPIAIVMAIFIAGTFYYIASKSVQQYVHIEPLDLENE